MKCDPGATPPDNVIEINKNLFPKSINVVMGLWGQTENGMEAIAPLSLSGYVPSFNYKIVFIIKDINILTTDL